MIYNKNIAHIELECENEIIQLAVDKIKEESYFFLYEMSFSTYQQPFWFNLKTNLKLIWSIIRGRCFVYMAQSYQKKKWKNLKNL